MGNTESSSSSSERKRSKRRNKDGGATDVASRAKQVVGESVRDLQANIQTHIKQLEEQDHPAAHFLDSMCGVYMDERDVSRRGPSSSFYSEEYNSDDDDERTYSEDETTTTTDYNGKRGRARERRRDDPSVGADTASYLESDYEERGRRGKKKNNGSGSFESEDSYSRNGASEKSTAVSTVTEDQSKATASASGALPKPLASSFAKRCYFTKAGIGSSTQHYEGLTLTGNVVLMLAQAMKLKGCPTICDEDLRRVEQTYPNQFSRLPDELLLSSGWRRISKYCHFSNKPVPDGIPFFHSKQRLHPTGGYYFLLAAAVGMVRPIDVEPLTRDTLVLLETDYPTACDAAPKVLIEDPDQWTLVDKFCFFSGGPINTDEDVYYQADFDGNPIFMLAFLSPSLTPGELYKLELGPEQLAAEPGLRTVMAVQEVESVYDLTDRDFDDLRLYHLGPCRALPQYILQPTAWAKVLPPHFLHARDAAIQRAEEYELATNGAVGMHGMASVESGSSSPSKVHQLARQIPANASFSQGHPPLNGADPASMQPVMHMQQMPQHMDGMQMPQQHMDGMQMPQQQHMDGMQMHQPMGMPMQMMHQSEQMQMHQQMQMPQMQHQSDNMEMQQHFVQEEEALPMDEAEESSVSRPNGMDPPEDEPPSLSKRGESVEEAPHYAQEDYAAQEFGPPQEQFVQQDYGPQHGEYSYGFDQMGQPVQGYPDANAPMGYEQNQNFANPDQQMQNYQDGQQGMIQTEQGYPDAQIPPSHYPEEAALQPDHQMNDGTTLGYQEVPLQHDQRYSSAERQRLQGESDEHVLHRQQDQRYGSAERQRMQYEEEQEQKINQQRYDSAERQRMQFQNGQEQRYPSTERRRLQYPEEESVHNMPEERRYSSSERRRMQYQDDEDSRGLHQEKRYSSAERQRMQYHDDGEEVHAMQHEQRYSSSERQRMQYQEEDDEELHAIQQEQRYSSAERQRNQYNDDQADGYESGAYRSDEDAGEGEEEQGEEEYYQQEQVNYQGSPEEAYYAVSQEKTQDSDDYPQPSLQYSEEKTSVGYTESKDDDGRTTPHDPASPMFEYSTGPNAEQKPEPVSPPTPTPSQSQAQTPSEYSHTSSAMRGARELLKRNRQKRLDLAARRSHDQSEITTASTPKDVPSPKSEASGGTWESGSEATSVVSAASSQWTENSSAPERSSRRALILQMAKARMKGNGKGSGSTVGEPSFGNPEIRGTYSITEEEKKLDGPVEEDQATDIDIDVAGDLD